MTRAQAQGDEIQARESEKDFPRLLEASRGEIARVLPEGVSVDRVCRMALTAYKLNPALRGCTPLSILTAVMKAAELGLEPHGGLRQCWLIPFHDRERKVTECTFMIGYQGVLELARRSGAFRVIEARTVRDTDEFRLEYTPRPSLLHRPDLGDAGLEIGSYAYAILTGGETVLEWLSLKTLNQMRELSRQPSIWNQWWSEKARNAALKRLLKRQPCSVELRQALEWDDDAVRAEVAPAPALAPGTAWGSRAAALGARLKHLTAPAEVVTPDPEDYGGEAEEVAEGPKRQREPGEEG